MKSQNSSLACAHSTGRSSNSDSGSNCQAVISGNRKAARLHFHNCCKRDACKMTSCDESADSVNGSLVAKSNFVVIGEAGVENKAVTTEENPIINTLFSPHLAVLQLMMSLISWMFDKRDAKRGMENSSFVGAPRSC